MAGNNGLVMTEMPSSSEIAQRIVEALHPRRVVLFGSRARGDAGVDSDFDLMVETDSDLRPHERARQIYGLFGPRRWSMDVVVYTPGEVLAQRQFRNSLIRSIEREGQVLYEQPG